MTQYSQNGWSAKDASVIDSYTVPNSPVTLNLRRGDVAVVLLYVAEQVHKRVEALRNSVCGGYNPRSIIDSNVISNHASGTAIDLNWDKHPMGVKGTFTSAQVATIQAILKECDGVVRWGGNYHARKDEMHFEIVTSSAAKVKALADKLRAGSVKPVLTPAPKAPTLRRGSKGAWVKLLQEKLNAHGAHLRVDSDYGDHTTDAVRSYQTTHHLSVDGIAGPQVWGSLGVAA